MIKRMEDKYKIYRKNIKKSYDKEYKNLDSSIKKLTGFVKKIKLFNENNYESIIKEIKILNLTRYISEIVNAVIEMKFKINNLGLLMKLLSKIHRIYKDFSVEYCQNLVTKLDQLEFSELDSRKLKIFMRLYCDSIFYGFFSNADCEIIRIMNKWNEILDHVQNHEYVYTEIYTYFIQIYCNDFGIFNKSKLKLCSENNINYHKYIILHENTRSDIKLIINENYQILMKNYLNLHKDMVKLDKHYKSYIGLHGELTIQQKEKQNKFNVIFTRLDKSIKFFNDLFDIQFTLPCSISEDCVDIIVDKIKPTELVQSEEVEEVNKVWEDSDEREFYDKIKELSGSFIKVSDNDLERIKKTIKENVKKSNMKKEVSNINDDEDDFEIEEMITFTKKLINPVMEGFITKLQNSSNRELIDQLVVEYLTYLNTKCNKKNLRDALFIIPKNRIDLLPFYARFQATIFPYLPEIVLEIKILLRKEFYYHIRKSNQFSLDFKLKTCRYIGELVKFKIFSKAEAIQFVRSLIQNFQNHTIDMLVYLLETCGRFLTKSSESEKLMENLINIIRRKLDIMSDERQRIMIINAINSCYPAESVKKCQKKLNEIQSFINYILNKVLNKNNYKEVAQLITYLPCETDEICINYLVKMLTSPWKYRYSYLTCLASLLYCLKSIQNNIVIKVIDGILEEIRLLLENNIPRYNQRRISIMRYISELYKFQIIQSDMLLRILYQILTYGHTGNKIFVHDKVENNIRIILICEVLKSSAPYLKNDVNFKLFETFLLLFQAYIWNKKLSDYYVKSKRVFPASVQFIIIETFEALKVKKMLYDSPQKLNEVLSRIDQCDRKNIDYITNKLSTSIMPTSSTIPTITTTTSNTTTHERSEDFNKEISNENGSNINGTNIESSNINSNNINSSNIDSTNIESTNIESSANINEEFDKEYDNIVLSSLIENKNIPIQRGECIDENIPTVLKEKYNSVQENMERDIIDVNKDQLNILIMTKNNNKKMLKNITIPKSDTIAASAITKYNTRKDEQEQIKNLILNMNFSGDHQSDETKTKIVVKSIK